MSQVFYAVCERATNLMFTELAYFKTLEEAEDFLRNLELYPNGKTRFMNSRFARIVKYYEGGKDQCYNRNQHIFFIEKKKFFN